MIRWLIGSPLALPAALVARYPELREARWRRGGLAVRVGGWCLGRASVAGITLWRTIWLAEHVALESELLLHELRHVHQFQEDRAFPFKYLWQSLRRGYLRNRYELDADAYAARRIADAPHTM
jgi:hypothetical protein